ncbi:MAG: MFS transporter, partial [Candidatus Heimdallarchaeota archaeon]|nr:MFS transporter [Candidatus Heimdallarchaeota archaeon]MCK5049708.1 MFS transporter [Candidatus Heimdallarchaeota archaeon]
MVQSPSSPEIPLKTLLSCTSIGIFMSVIDGSIVNVSLETMSNYFDISMDEVSWVTIIYLLTISSLIAISGKLGDAFGRKKIYQLGLIIFTFGSFLCGISPSLNLLLAGRIIQAIGASGIMANGLAIVTYFTSPKNRGRAIGVNSMIVATALSIGPFLGGVITQFFGWQYIFFVNIPLGIIGWIMFQRRIPETETHRKGSFDILGAFLFAFALIAFIFSIRLASSGTTVQLFSVIMILVICSYLFVKQEKRVNNPVIDLQLLRNPKLSVAIVTGTFVYLGISSLIFLIPFYLQEVRLWDQAQTGMILIGVPITMSFTGILAGFLSERIDAKILTGIGIIIELGAFMALTKISPDYAPFTLLLIMATIGFAVALFTTPNGNSAMSSVPRDKLGVSSGLLNLSRNIGFILGTTLSTTLFDFYFKIMNYYDSPEETNAYNEAYSSAIGMVFWTVSTLLIVAFIVSWFRGNNINELPTTSA